MQRGRHMGAVAGLGLALAMSACSSSTSPGTSGHSTDPDRSNSSSSTMALGPTVISSPTQAYALLSGGFPNASCEPGKQVQTSTKPTDNAFDPANYYPLLPTAKQVYVFSCDNSVILILGDVHDSVDSTKIPSVTAGRDAVVGTNWVALWVDDPDDNDASAALCKFKNTEGLLQATVYEDGSKATC